MSDKQEASQTSKQCNLGGNTYNNEYKEHTKYEHKEQAELNENRYRER